MLKKQYHCRRDFHMGTLRSQFRQNLAQWPNTNGKRCNGPHEIASLVSYIHGRQGAGTGVGLMLGAVGLTLLNMSMKRESHTMAVSGLGLMATGVVVYLGSLIFLSY